MKKNIKTILIEVVDSDKFKEQWLVDAGFSPRCSLESVEVAEHGANSAMYSKDV